MGWKITNNRIVAYFDIMGFKNLVQYNTHKEILSKMQLISLNVKNFEEGHIEAYGKKSNIKTIIFSDSILLITEDDKISSAIHIILISSFLMRICFKSGIPIKGGIAYGKLTADFEKSIFFGQPLIDAFLLEDEMHLYSIIIHHSFETKYKDKHFAKEKLSMSGRWFKYLTPFKDGKANHFHINWIYYELGVIIGKDNYKKKEKEIESRICEIKDQINHFYLSASGKIRTYIDNTIDLVDLQIKNTKEIYND